MWLDDFKQAKLAIHCETNEQAEELLKILHENGFKWSGGDPLLHKTYWYKYKENICYSSYFSSEYHIGYGTVEFFEKEGVKVIKFSDIQPKIKYLTDLEMIAKLRENPRLRAVIAEPKYDGTYAQFKNGILRWFGTLQNGQEAFINDRSKQWQVIDQSVTWQEAILAWANGKTIECHHDDGSGVEVYQNEHLLKTEANLAVSSDEILTGTWYIREDQQ